MAILPKLCGVLHDIWVVLALLIRKVVVSLWCVDISVQGTAKLTVVIGMRPQSLMRIPDVVTLVQVP